MSIRMVRLSLGFCFLSTLAVVQQARATLGEPVGSVASDRKAMSAVKHAAVSRDGYTIQEFKTGGSLVREYVSPSGVVFAVAWNGLSHPDLTPLLGSYFGEYRQALRRTQSRRGQRSMQVKANRVVVEKWGHMRNLQGRAYLPALIPSGVTINEIK